MWTDALEHIVGRVEFKTLRKSDLRQFHPLQTIGLLAYLTEEMGVLVIIMVMVVTVAEFVLRAITTALDGMHQMMLAEEGEGAEYIRLVDGSDPMLQFCQRLGQHGGCQGLHHHNAVGRGFDVVLFEQSDVVRFVHFFCFVGKDTIFFEENEGVTKKKSIFAI